MIRISYVTASRETEEVAQTRGTDVAVDLVEEVAGAAEARRRGCALITVGVYHAVRGRRRGHREVFLSR